MKVLYFGTYQRDYPRNELVISCLEQAGIDVEERHIGVWDGQRDSWQAGPATAARLALAEARLLRRRLGRFDVLIVGYPGQFDLPAARWAARGAPVVFNPLVSLSDTMVADRGRFSADSPVGRALKAADRWAFRHSDLVVCDTEAHAEYLARLAGADRRRFGVCFVGADDRLFHGPWAPAEPFRALFVGKLIPLHGLETILAAARLAPGITFHVAGSGQLRPMLHSAPENVEHTPWIDYEQLPDHLRRAGCALGVFGTSDKAARVIPNKAFQALACGTPLVTADSPAARELLVDGESALLVPAGDPAALAAAVGRLAGDRRLATAVGEGGRRIYERRASGAVLGKRWRQLLEGTLADARR